MFELRILNGLKSGVSFPLDTDILQVGSAADSDILMLDNAFDNAKLSLFCTESGLVKVNILAGNFTDERGKPLLGEREWGLDHYLHIQGVWLKIDKSDAKWPSDLPVIKEKEPAPESKFVIKSRRRNDFLFVGGFIACILGLYNVADAALTKVDKKDINGPIAVESVNKESVKPISSIQKATTSSAVTTVEAIDYKKLVKTMIKERELTGLDVSYENDTLHLTGNLSKREKSIVERMIIRYQFENPNGPIIVDSTDSFAESFPVDIVSVVSGLYGHVLLGDGTRLSLGQVYKGYKLVAIRKGSVEFQGKTKVSVNW